MLCNSMVHLCFLHPMCGIAGFLSSRIAPADREAAVARMNAAMLHRGPDDGGCGSWSDATLGMRRLAIFDPANGRQPMSTPDGRWHIVFNGAIYNFRALRSELEAKGHVFRTHCDTEILLGAVAEWGEAALPRLRGMFAFAAWDDRKKTLLLARDPFGIKPLYFARGVNGSLLFASELNALLASGQVPAALDPAAAASYLAWLAVPAPQTIWQNVSSLRPGECATWRDGVLKTKIYWSVRDAALADIAPCASRADFVAGLRAQLEDSVRAHVLADVPVGAFLSGGLDSAAIVALMTKLGGSKLKTFSIGFDEAGYSEAEAAAASARHLGAEHHASVLTGRRVADDLGTLIATLDQPTGDGINTYYVSEAARAGGVTVALSGLGGDELFGGYPSFREVPRLARWLPLWQLAPTAVRDALLARWRRGGDTRWLKLADILDHARTPAALALLQRRVFAEPARTALLAAESPYAPHPAEAKLARDLAGAPLDNVISAAELRGYMADVLLRDSDAMSMAHSLELRVPFVDVPLITWLWRQSPAWRTQPATLKTALADATRDLLPPGVVGRAKRGFTLPFAAWMKKELRPFLDETFSPASVGRSGLFAPAAVRTQWETFLAGHDPRAWSRVWSLAVLVAFANRPAVSKVEPPAMSRAKPPAPGVITLRSAPLVLRPPEPEPLDGRTLLMVPEIFASEGGIPRIVRAYLRALTELAAPGEPTRLLALNDPAIAPADAVGLDAAIGCGRDKRAFVRTALRLARGCERVVCGHVAQLPVAWLARRFNRRLRYYLVAHGIEVWRPFSTAERLALRGAERIFCVSDFTRRELLRHCPLPPGRAVVLPNALDPSFAIAPGAPLASCPPVILCVTRLTQADRYKGVEHLIAALPAVRAAVPGATLRIVGRGDDVDFLRGLAHRLDLKSAVEFLGFVDDARLAAELAACRLFALPSKKEGFGLVFLEAMARGRPCLGARAGGVPEVITPETGTLVEYGDVPALAAACADALRREWDEAAILARARAFSYSPFKTRLASLLTA
jgi:asparagine synthase (glutamine-hydrolysing)